NETFAGDRKALDKVADKIGLDHKPAPASVTGLDDTVADAVKGGCEDVLLYVAGHGLAPPPEENPRPDGKVLGGGRGFFAPKFTGPPMVELSGGNPNKKIPAQYLHDTDLLRIVSEYEDKEDPSKSTAFFKIKVQSCYSG